MYSRYTNPKELINSYIKRGRFGEFVCKVVESENQRKKAEAEKEDESKLWSMYIHLMPYYPGKSFIQWKEEFLRPSGKAASRDENMTNEDIMGIIDDLFPNGGK